MTKGPILTYSSDALLGIDKLISLKPNACPVNECNEEPTRIGKFLICLKHGLEIHKSTFVYYNGDTQEDKKKARLRNLLLFGGKDFVTKHILDNSHKAESHRLGYENSEDALTWNIFGGILYYERLNKVYELLTGELAAPNQLELFLWGLKIDFNNPPKSKLEPWPCLRKVQDALESDIKRYHTEPDIMILGPNHLVCIEAKFTSGNPIALSVEVAEGEKPKSRKGLIERYIIGNKLWNPTVIKAEELEKKIHSQLLRMIVFTSTMAQQPELGRRDWIVANIVSKTQWDKVKTKLHKDKDYTDPTQSIPSKVRDNFKFIYWERDIYEKIIRPDPKL